MALDETEQYICERCFSTDTAPGPCPRCGIPRRYCNLGGPEDVCRRPLMDADGHILSRAPMWWVQHAPSRRPPPAEGRPEHR
jgi:hypothetical protein